jgi:outer membrane protein assembly factor BamB
LRQRLRILLLVVAAAAPVPAAVGCAAGPGAPSGTPATPASTRTVAKIEVAQAPRVLAGALWRFRAGGPVRETPVVSDGLVLVGSDDGALHALDARDGSERWRVTTAGRAASSPAVLHGLAVFESGDGVVHAVRQTTGEEIWRFAFDAGSRDPFVPSPVAAGERIVAAGETGAVVALDPGSGSVMWRFHTGSPLHSSPCADGDSVFVADAGGRMEAIDAATGAERWRFEAAATALSAPVTSGTEVLVAAADGRAFALDRASGRLLWTHAAAAPAVLSSPAAGGGLAFFAGGEGAAFEADRIDGGQAAWRFASALRASSPTLASGLVLFGTDGGTLFALDAQSGREAWRFPSMQAILAAPAIGGGRVYFGNDAGEVFALAGPGDGAGSAWVPWRAVYFDPSIHGASEGADVLAEILRGRGYLALDARTLPRFLEDRLADGVPSVVVFASVVAPRAILSPGTAKTALVRRYLDAGGRIVWPGIVPFGFFTDPDDDRPTADLGAAARALGVRQSRTAADEERAEVTPEGRSLGLPAWWLAVMPAERSDVTTVLGQDADGGALAWTREYAHGGLFVRFGGRGLPLDDPEIVWRTAERDRPCTGIPDPFDLRFIAGGEPGAPSGSGTDHPAADGVAHQASGVVDLELPGQAHAMRLHRLDADAQERGDLLHRLPLGDQLQHLALPGAQGIGRRGRAVEMRPQHVPGDSRAEVQRPARHLADGAHQVFRRPRLQEVP